MRKSGRPATKVAVGPFEESLPEALDVLVRFLELNALKSADLFLVKANKVEVDMLMAKIEKEGRTALLGKETSVYAAGNLLDLLLNAMSTPVIPCEYFEIIRLALAQSSERDRTRCLRRIVATLPPGNRSLLLRLASLLAALRSKQRYNKVDQECVDSVFSYVICHEKSETACGDTSSLLAETISKNHSALFGKKVEEVSVEKDVEFPAQFLSVLRQGCDHLANGLLPQPPPPPQSHDKRRTARNSRKASGGWDDVFAVIKPLTSKGETNKPKLSPFAKELGKLLFEGKMGAAKKYLEKRTKELEAAVIQESVLPTAEGQYSGARNSAGLPHGIGKLLYANGDVYSGSFQNGKVTGKGELLLADGTRFEGEFLDGALSGAGSCKYSNGDVYIGQFENDAFHGEGKYVSAHSSYEGGFEGGLRHGKGVFVTRNFTYSGEYVNDQMCGLGIYTFASGDEYRGQFEASQFHGKGIFVSAKSKQRVEGLFERGRYVGPDPNAK